jgi:hypothetical protein
VYTIIDQSGKTVQQNAITVHEGSNSVELVISALAPGAYTVIIKGETMKRQVRFIKD